jgi:flagellar biosynthesis protein FliR
MVKTLTSEALTLIPFTTYATKTKTQTVWLIHSTIRQFNKRLTFSIIGLSFLTAVRILPRTVPSLVAFLIAVVTQLIEGFRTIPNMMASLASLAHNSYNDKTKRKSSFFSFIFPTIEKIKNKTY